MNINFLEEHIQRDNKLSELIAQANEWNRTHGHIVKIDNLVAFGNHFDREFHGEEIELAITFDYSETFHNYSHEDLLNWAVNEVGTKKRISQCNTQRDIEKIITQAISPRKSPFSFRQNNALKRHIEGLRGFATIIAKGKLLIPTGDSIKSNAIELPIKHLEKNIASNTRTLPKPSKINRTIYCKTLSEYSLKARKLFLAADDSEAIYNRYIKKKMQDF
ncbi:hypothetical protein [Vibrio barjaei]|uniref:hypothetical protein n=1 Tax=Vibrio barjaei TaxID=1676683 RepID=UPI00228386C1|nr:hypothetical protein [Vibrio barjaei]MCY9872951.1 hypothetical protein [Vibrio barjaei]